MELQDKDKAGARDINWAVLMDQITAGDAEALRQLYDGTSRYVYGLSIFMLKNEAAAAEVVVEVYLQIWRVASRFHPERGAVLSWILAITRDKSLDRLRSTRPAKDGWGCADQPRVAPDELEDPEEALVRKERQGLAQACMGQLEPAQREAIEAAFFSGLRHQELALHLNQTTDVVKSRIRCGIAKLREALKSSNLRKTHE